MGDKVATMADVAALAQLITQRLNSSTSIEAFLLRPRILNIYYIHVNALMEVFQSLPAMAETLPPSAIQLLLYCAQRYLATEKIVQTNSGDRQKTTIDAHRKAGLGRARKEIEEEVEAFVGGTQALMRLLNTYVIIYPCNS